LSVLRILLSTKKKKKRTDTNQQQLVKSTVPHFGYSMTKILHHVKLFFNTYYQLPP